MKKVTIFGNRRMNAIEKKEFITVVAGGSVLAIVAGMINAVSLSGLFTVPVSHVTGTITNTGLDIARGQWPLGFYHFGLLVFFWLGSVTCGLIIKDGAGTFRLGRGYGYVLLTETCAILFGYFLIQRGWYVSEFVLIYACGMQNAMASTYSGAVLRTTHMTGILTDLGTLVAQRILKGNNAKDTWKFSVFLPLLFGYFLGAIGGGYLYSKIGSHTLWIPAFFLGTSGFLYLSSSIVEESRQNLKIEKKMILQKEQIEKIKLVEDFLTEASDRPAPFELKDLQVNKQGYQRKIQFLL